MNKLFAIAFMCIYLLMSVGVAKTTHYCMGREKSTKVFSFESKKCPCSAFLPKNNGCCEDEHELLIIDDSQTPAPSLAPPVANYFVIEEIQYREIAKEIAYASSQFIVEEFAPPPKETIFKINCSFVFYDEELS
ncbi:MAG TPA: hypothetical protein PK325_09190 [Cyclobacteriaceae bacterium]|nr:hypothetical protein [Cyclobacteriaceae bacterium]HMV09980.1 hypothetical protein [Cyclobacteriaceae bacterium]HMV89818.1 hypothetical protein [Cyclobacteriaceae bacterium]HMX01581.1 hypothetical protein [Cyclobacteriaceae bacterium]HMX50725.1 hypothetical protein [Cyclobacteriaceae bacterium]